MRKPEKSKDDLIAELQEIRQKYDSVKLELELRLKEKENENLILEKLINASESFIHFSEEVPDYEKITKLIVEISGASYATLNIFDNTGGEFTTVSIVGLNENLRKGLSLLGFEVIGKHWKQDISREQKISNQTITKFNSLSEITGDSVSNKVISLIEKTFDLGETFIVKISKENKVLGSFTLIFNNGKTLSNQYQVDLYAHQVGMFLERNKITESLMISQEKYRLLVENTCESIYVLQDGFFKYANTMCCQMIGYNMDELMGMSMLDFLDKDDQEIALSQHLKILKGEIESGRKDFRVINRKGDVKWADVNSVRIQWDGRAATLNFATDISERKRAEELLKKSEAKSSAILNTLPDMMFVQDVEGVFLDYTLPPNAVKHDPPKVFVGQKIENVLPEDLVKKFKPIFINALVTGEVQFMEYSLKMPDKLHYFEARTINFDANQVISIVRDITDRKIAEESLTNERFLLRTLIDNIPDAIYSKDLECRKTLANKAEVNYMGANSESEIIGKNDFDVYDKDIASKFYEDDMWVINTGKELINREEFIYHEGKPKTCLLTSKLPLKDQNGNIIGLVGIGRDITEQKLFEEALYKSEAKQKRMIANIGDVIVIIDKDGINRYKSPNIKKWFGWEPEELVGKNTLDNVHQDDIEHARNTILSIMSQPETIKTTQLRYKCKDGNYKWIEFTGINLLHDSEIEGILGNYHDITERKLNEEKILNSEQRYKMLFDRSNDAIFIIDSNSGKYLNANKAAEVLTGRGIEEIVKCKTQDLTPSGATTRLKIVSKVENVLDMGEVEYLKPDGTIRIAQLSTIPLKNGEVYGIAKDITDRKIAESEIKSKNDELIRANADKDKFMSILAHDLKSPFSSILGFISLLIANIRVYDIEKTERILSSMNKASQNTFNLLEDLLLWVRSQSGKIPYNPQNIRLNELISDIIETLSQNANLKRIDLLYFGDNTIKVFADIDMLKTVLRNLITNAIKFTNVDGRIDVKAFKQEKSIKISVSDNGIGMSSEVLEKLFEVSQTNSRMGTAKESGTGLGLIICKEFVEKHNGNIIVESQPGQGSTFTIELPVIP